MSRTGSMSGLLVVIALSFCSLTTDGDTEPLNTTVGEYSFGYHARTIRESRPLIGPFDLSKKLKKAKQPVGQQPSAALQAARILGQNIKNIQNISSSSPILSDSVVLDTSPAPDAMKSAKKTKSPRENDFKMESFTVAPNTKIKSRKTPKKRKTKIGVGARTEQATALAGQRAALLPGDLLLGGLVTVHGRGAGATACGALRLRGVQALEAMMFALAAAGPPAPGVRLGALVLDDCDTDTRGLEMALDFIKGSISNINAEQRACNASSVAGAARATGDTGPGGRQVIAGVVGAASSVTSVQVANLLRLFKIPQVSFLSTSPELSNKARFEYFMRTIPSDSHQVRAMVEIAKKLEWRYVSVIYEESNYGIKAFEDLETMLARNNICIAVKERLMRESGEPHDSTYDGLVQRLMARPRARGVIVFACEREVAALMAAVRRRGANVAFGWLGSDCWAGGAMLAAGNERALEGAIGVQLQAKPVRGFREYFLNLTVENNPRNPWFAEFWEQQFGCRYPGARAGRAGRSGRRCSGAERLASDTPLEGRLQFVADAVFAFVHAVRDMHRELCGGRAGLCARMRPLSGPMLLHYLRRVRFTGLSGDEFHFDANGDGPARYDILHYRRAASGGHRWLKVGRYLDGDLHLDLAEIQPRTASVCSAECAAGQARRYAAGDSCCWHCYNCTQYEASLPIRSPVSHTTCAQCPPGTLPDAARVSCLPVPARVLRPAHPALAAALACSAFGALLTALKRVRVRRAVGALWALRGDTPVVRASGRELSLVLLVGILMCYLVPFVLALRPTDGVCALQRFGSALCFTVVYAALLTKTNRIARIFSAPRRSARRPPLISPRSQLAICALLVSVQVALVAVWQAAAPARAVHHFPTRAHNLLVCDSYVDASYALAFLYPVLLIAVCTVHAVLTRNIPEAFNESKHIGFAMYTTCVIWFAFVPLHLGTTSRVPLRVTSLALTISLSASVTLACLFAPKVYIILVRPERNVRASLMPARWRARGAAGGAAGGAVCAALVGAAPLPGTGSPPPLAYPSTDFSKTEVSGRSTSNERQVQTEEDPRWERAGGALPLDPRRLAGLAAGLPAFALAPGALRRRGVRDAAPI
ncbi:PREDICTED: metabotropic glutamate receptor 6-like [Papilio xuthus]|uniref:Metabotropic glutamate receptor 6-like n=1 Tax=Papilio xuthus TaxID=66420 RepID=A0AAJ6ZWE2_PAPXU|nr:PREDICTED: metabotropic glutamate receptor 6-like [Papilio xuthus]